MVGSCFDFRFPSKLSLSLRPRAGGCLLALFRCALILSSEGRSRKIDVRADGRSKGLLGVINRPEETPETFGDSCDGLDVGLGKWIGLDPPITIVVPPLPDGFGLDRVIDGPCVGGC